MIAISYRREDSLPIAGRLYDRLHAKFGKKNVFMDFDSIPPGADFRQQIKEMIERSNLVIAIIGPHWLGEQPDASRRIDNPADFVRLEIAYALEGGIPVIPLLINSTQMPKPDTLPPDIKELAFRHALPLDSGMDFHSHADRLIAGIGQVTDAARKRRRLGAYSAKAQPARPTTDVPRTSFGKLVVGTSVALLLAVVALVAWYIATHQYARVRSKSVVEQNSPPAVTKPATVNIASITKEHPYVNSLGMKFVPVPGTKVLFSVWDTRVKDYRIFADATKHDWPKTKFKQTYEDPAVNVSWDDATGFCKWLTESEQKGGLITASQSYRLPTDLEWSAAVGLEKESESTPEQRDKKVKDIYPWAAEWPPSKGVGNYHPNLGVDDYEFTSPVGSFKANRYGLYDLGGNAWQWCQDWWNAEKRHRVVRGGSCGNYEPEDLLSSRRDHYTPNYRNDNGGFRCALSGSEIASAEDETSPSNQSVAAAPAQPSSPKPAAKATPNDIKPQKLTKVFVKKYGVSVLLPSDVFPDIEMLGTGTSLSLTHDLASVTFYDSDKSLRQTFEDHVAGAAAEVNQNVDYSVLKNTWFVVSGVFGLPGQRAGFYTKGVKKGNNVIMMRLHYSEENYPFADDTLTAISRGFDGNLLVAAAPASPPAQPQPDHSSTITNVSTATPQTTVTARPNTATPIIPASEPTATVASSGDVTSLPPASSSGVYQKTRDGHAFVWNNYPSPEDEAEWSGAVDESGYATGQGTLSWFKRARLISRYTGTMVAGKFNGNVVNDDPNGKRYSGTYINGVKSNDWHVVGSKE